MSELQKRACDRDLSATENWSLTTDECLFCKASMAQMEAELAALLGLKSQILVRIQELTAPKQVAIARVKLTEFFTNSIDSEEAVEQIVTALKEHLLDLVSKGAKIILE